MSEALTAAQEGSIAHDLAAHCLKEGTDAASYVGQTIELEEYQHAALSPSGAYQWMTCPASYAMQREQSFMPGSYSKVIDAGMAGYVQLYVNAVRERITHFELIGAKRVELRVEQRVPIGHITTEEGATGTADVVIIAEFDGCTKLEVHDAKFGFDEVLAEENPQLQMYALGVLEQLADQIDLGLIPEATTVRLVIHQPRLHVAPSEWDTTTDALAGFFERAHSAAKQAINAVGYFDSWRSNSHAVYFTPDAKACKWCTAKAVCPALRAEVARTALGDFEALNDPESKPVPVPTEAFLLSVAWEKIPLIEAWCKAVNDHVHAENMAGRTVPNTKLVLGRRGNRGWKDETLAEETLKGMRLKHDEMYKYTLASPTRIEEVLAKDSPRRWKKLQPLIGQSDGKPCVVAASDKRAAWVPAPADADFEAIDTTADEEAFA